MSDRYQAIISNKAVYKVIDLPINGEEIKVGMGIDCDVRLRRDLFFDEFRLMFFKNSAGEWLAQCSENLYMSVGDVRKLTTIALSHGDTVDVKYQESGHTVFRLDFLIDFQSEKFSYERAIDISSSAMISIGGAANSNIVLNSQYTANDSIELRRQGTSLLLTVRQTSYGVYYNGKRIKHQQEIRDKDFFSLSDFSFFYRDGTLWTPIRQDMSLRELRYTDVPVPKGYPEFHRNTRFKHTINDEKIRVLDPPSNPQKPKNNMMLRLLPSLGMLLAAGVMAFFGGAMILFAAVSAGMAILTSVLNFKEGNKDYEKQVADRLDKYCAYIQNKRTEIEQYRNEERHALEKIYISQEEEIRRLRMFSPDLFDRIPTDDDFLIVRLGTGAVEAKRKIDYKTQERLETDDELQMIPEQLCREYQYLANAPVVCDFKTANAVGIVGAEAERFSFLKNIVIDIAARQFHTDVKTVFVAEENHEDRLLWLRFLPHVYSERAGGRLLVVNDESRNLIFEYMYKELSQREQTKSYSEWIVVFFYDLFGFNSHPISRFVSQAQSLGVTFVFFGTSKSEIPLGCSYIIDIKDSAWAELKNTEDAFASTVFTYPTVSNGESRRIVDFLAPVCAEEISLESSLTKRYSLFEMLNIISVDDLDLENRWRESKVYQSMAAPIGISKTGIVTLNLSDKAHGPHGLVAGTTGSGKSELLQTYILSMCTLYHPYEVAFLIIDFKGGGMVNQFSDLPHLLGAITNIDGKAINRSLRSIKAELQKRQRLFAEAEVNHIDKYIQRFRAGEVTIPLPHLIVIVDEFAELKAEQPDFMKELISTARIGRSLGVHLILATQKPSGQVNEQIWSNSRFKLCLKVQSQEDSNEVLKSPLAAEIKEPGRAYLQVGNNEIFELFQSAYSGEPEKPERGNKKEFAIYSLTPPGKRIPVYIQKKGDSDEKSVTQLEAVVSYIDAKCKQMNLERLPDICLPTLGDSIAFDAGTPSQRTGISVDIGIFDDPDNQYQGVYSVDLSAGNLMIIGSSQSGKTNILQTIIRGLATRYTAGEVSIYVIDFASMVLKNFEKLNHVGGVVCPSDDEKLKNLFKLLESEVAERKEKLLSVGVSSYTAYREAGKTDIPQIVLIIDNLTALKELYFADDDALLSLCREGLTVGISVVIANAQTAGIGYKYLSNFSTRIALFCNDVNEYSALLDHCSLRIDSIPGRCVVEIEKRQLECQSYLAFQGEKEIDRVKEIRSFIVDNNQVSRGFAARNIPLIPPSLTEDYIVDQFSSDMQSGYAVVAGMDYGTVMPYTIDFGKIGILGVSGREKSGKHNWIRYCVSMLDRMYPEQTKVYVVDGVSWKLAGLKKAPNVCAYTLAAEDAVRYIKEIEQTLQLRYAAMAAGRSSGGFELLLLVMDNMDAVKAICGDREALESYQNIISRYRELNVGIILSSIDNASIPYGAPEMLKTIRDSRHMLFFDDMPNMKIYDMPLAVTRSFKKPIEVGDGYYIRNNDCFKLKTAMSGSYQNTEEL